VVVFSELEVYGKSVSLAAEIRSCVSRWPSFDQWTIGTQLARAAGSIGANLAEASGRFGHRDEQRFIVYARGSALEMQHWIRLAQAAGLSCPDSAGARAEEIGRMLNGLLRAKRALIPST
jgi:four helix bundle protein